jgi:DNA-binding transcriptional LysR family regulator
MYSQNIDFRHLRYFIAVAEELHFSRAAEKLQIAQPPLSYQIRQLEQTLGVQLFERNHHSVTLTNAGQVLLEEARIVLAQMEHALARTQDAQKGLAGGLEIGFIGRLSAIDLTIPDILQRYHQHFPAVKIQLREMYIQEQLQALQEQRIHIGFLASHQSLPEEVASMVIQRIPFAAVLAPQHPLASQPAVPLRSLLREPFIFCPRTVMAGLYDRVIQICGFDPPVAQELDDLGMVLGLVAANLGVTLMPMPAIVRRDQGVVYRPLADNDADIFIETMLIWRRNDNSPLIQNFLAAAREVLKQREEVTASDSSLSSRLPQRAKEGNGRSRHHNDG